MATLVCVLVAIDWALYQQILFVGAALSATVWVCSLEAWSCQEAPTRNEDEGRRHNPAGRIAASEPLPAVDGEHMAQDVARAVPAEEEDGVGDVVAVGDAAQGDALKHRLLIEPTGP